MKLAQSIGLNPKSIECLSQSNALSTMFYLWYYFGLTALGAECAFIYGTVEAVRADPRPSDEETHHRVAGALAAEPMIC